MIVFYLLSCSTTIFFLIYSTNRIIIKSQDMLFTPKQLLALLGGFTVMLVQGSLYVFGTMTPYIYTYLYYQGQTDLEVSQLSIIITLAVVMINVGIFFSCFKIISFPHRITSLITVIGISLSMLALSFCQTFSLYVLVYGFIYGIFIGYGYLAPLKNTFEHLPNRKGLCSGTCLMGFGLGAFIFNFILVGIVNPDNLKQHNSLFPEEVGNNLPFALKILALVYAGIGILGVTLSVRSNTVTSNSNPLLEIAEDQEQEMVAKQPHYSPKIIKFAFKNKIFLLMFLLSMCVPYGIFISFHFKEYGNKFIDDDYFLSLLGSFGSVTNGVFRVILGATLDRIPFRTIMVVNILVFMISCGTIVFSVKEKVTYFITIVLTYGCYGSLFSIFPTQTVRIIGKVIGSKMYYITFLGFSFGSVLQYLFHRYLVGSYGVDGYTYCFIIFGCLQLVSLILTMTIKFALHKSEEMLLYANKNPKRMSTTLSNDDLTMIAQKDTLIVPQ